MLLPGSDEDGPGRLWRAAAEGERGSTLHADDLLSIGDVEARGAVGGDVGEGVEAEHHVWLIWAKAELGFGAFGLVWAFAFLFLHGFISLSLF
jgi:hypothetical protein